MLTSESWWRAVRLFGGPRRSQAMKSSDRRHKQGKCPNVNFDQSWASAACMTRRSMNDILVCAAVQCSLYVRGPPPRTKVQAVPSLVAGLFPHEADLASYPPRHAGIHMPLRILIADDSPAIRRLLRFFIEHNTDFHVYGPPHNIQLAVGQITEHKPHRP